MLLIIKRAVQTYMQKEIAWVFSMKMAWIVVTGWLTEIMSELLVSVSFYTVHSLKSVHRARSRSGLELSVMTSTEYTLP